MGPHRQPAHSATLVDDWLHCLATDQGRTPLNRIVEQHLVKLVATYLPSKLRDQIPVVVAPGNRQLPFVSLLAIDGRRPLDRKSSFHHFGFESEGPNTGAAFSCHRFADVVA